MGIVDPDDELRFGRLAEFDGDVSGTTVERNLAVKIGRSTRKLATGTVSSALDKSPVPLVEKSRGIPPNDRKQRLNSSRATSWPTEQRYKLISERVLKTMKLHGIASCSCGVSCAASRVAPLYPPLFPEIPQAADQSNEHPWFCFR